ncbi:hypothetical protein SLE2022_196920 [Rubroshorea leprosula]
MGCFGCTGGSSRESESIKNGNGNTNSIRRKKNHGPAVGSSACPKEGAKNDQFLSDAKNLNLNCDWKKVSMNGKSNGKEVLEFSFEELIATTRNFRSDCFLGEGGFGKVYKGYLERINQVVAIKQLDHSGAQGIKEFVVEVVTLSEADHPNLVKLMGYCAEGNQRLLVYEYMPLGSLENHLYDLSPDRKPLDWNTRMKIAAGAARGLEYLHMEMKPPIIYRDVKCSNILLGEEYHAKLSDFGLAKVGPSGDDTHVSTRVMGTYGYCAPDYAMTGQLNFKSDIFSFGVVLLELITGRKALDCTREKKEQNLVVWARPMFKDRKNFSQMADPKLQGQYPTRGLYQAIAVAAMCVQEQPGMRPTIVDVVQALNYLSSQEYVPNKPVHGTSASSRGNDNNNTCFEVNKSNEKKDCDDKGITETANEE